MSVNKDKAVVNPFTGDLAIVPDLLGGVTSKNTIERDIEIPADHTRMQSNPAVAEGVTVTVEEGGEFVVI